MPSLVIHISIAKEYIRKNKEKIKKQEDFIKGSIAPDVNENFTEIIKDKSKSHYGRWNYKENCMDIGKFLEDENVNINLDFWKGYLLHLLADYYFYIIDFAEEYNLVIKNNEKLYIDYYSLNRLLVKKYNITTINRYLEKYLQINNEIPKYLNEDKIIEFIEKISDFDLQEKIKIIKEKNMEGLK